jgi:hypothetical protein
VLDGEVREVLGLTMAPGTATTIFLQSSPHQEVPRKGAPSYANMQKKQNKTTAMQLPGVFPERAMYLYLGVIVPKYNNLH